MVSVKSSFRSSKILLVKSPSHHSVNFKSAVCGNDCSQLRCLRMAGGARDRGGSVRGIECAASAVDTDDTDVW